MLPPEEPALQCWELPAAQELCRAGAGTGEQGGSQAVHVRHFWTMNSSWLSGAAQTGTRCAQGHFGQDLETQVSLSGTCC